MNLATLLKVQTRVGNTKPIKLNLKKLKNIDFNVYYKIFSVDLLDNKKIDQVSLGSARHSIQPLNPYDQGTHCRNLCILQYFG